MPEGVEDAAHHRAQAIDAQPRREIGLVRLLARDVGQCQEHAGGLDHHDGEGRDGEEVEDGPGVATAKWFSPSLLIDYKFMEPTSALRPYVGIGFNDTRFYKLESTAAGDAANGGPTRVHLSSSFGPAGTVGLQYPLTREISLVASYSMARVNSHYRSDTAGNIRTTTIHFNPRAAIVALAYWFCAAGDGS